MAEEIHVGTIYWDAQVRGLGNVQQQVAQAGGNMQAGANGGGGANPSGGRIAALPPVPTNIHTLGAMGMVSPGANSASLRSSVGGGSWGPGDSFMRNFSNLANAAPAAQGMPRMGMGQRMGNALTSPLGGSMGMGLFMNFMFGGWEVAGSANAMGAANRFAQSNPGDLTGQAGAWNKALDRMTGGPLGSQAGAFIGAGHFREGIDLTLASAAAGDRKVAMSEAGRLQRRDFGRQDEIFKAEGDYAKTLYKLRNEYEDRRQTLADTRKLEIAEAVGRKGLAVATATHNQSRPWWSLAMGGEGFAFTGTASANAISAADRLAGGNQAREVGAAEGRFAAGMRDQPTHFDILRIAGEGRHAGFMAGRANQMRDTSMAYSNASWFNAVANNPNSQYRSTVEANRAAEAHALATQGLSAFHLLATQNAPQERAMAAQVEYQNLTNAGLWNSQASAMGMLNPLQARLETIQGEFDAAQKGINVLDPGGTQALNALVRRKIAADKRAEGDYNFEVGQMNRSLDAGIAGGKFGAAGFPEAGIPGSVAADAKNAAEGLRRQGLTGEAGKTLEIARLKLQGMAKAFQDGGSAFSTFSPDAVNYKSSTSNKSVTELLSEIVRNTAELKNF
jgi:hypothetical protein